MGDSSTRNARKLRNPHDDEEEKAHFQRIVAAFKYYRWDGTDDGGFKVILI